MSDNRIDGVVTIAVTVNGATANRSCRSLALAAGFDANPPAGVNQSFDLEVIPKESLRWVEAARCQLVRRVLGAHCATLKKGSGVFWCTPEVWERVRPAVDKVVTFYNAKRDEFLHEYDAKRADLVASYSPMVGAWVEQLAPTRAEMAATLGVEVSVDERTSVDATRLRNGLYDLCARLVGETTERKGKLPGENVEARRPQLAAAAEVVRAFAGLLPGEVARCAAAFEELSRRGLSSNGRTALKSADAWRAYCGAADASLDPYVVPAPAPTAPTAPTAPAPANAGSAALDDGIRATTTPTVTVSSADTGEKATVTLDDGLFRLLLGLLRR